MDVVQPFCPSATPRSVCFPNLKNPSYYSFLRYSSDMSCSTRIAVGRGTGLSFNDSFISELRHRVKLFRRSSGDFRFFFGYLNSHNINITKRTRLSLFTRVKEKLFKYCKTEEVLQKWVSILDGMFVTPLMDFKY